MLDGVLLEDGVSKFDSIEDAGGADEGANHWYKVRLTGGKYREVRRLFQSQDLEVARLIRIRFGDLTLPSSLRTVFTAPMRCAIRLTSSSRGRMADL